MPEQLLHLPDVDASVQQQRRRGRTQRVRRVDAPLNLPAVRRYLLYVRARKPLQVALDQQVHRRRCHRAVSQLFNSRVPPWPEERAAAQSRLPDVLGDGLGGGEVQLDGAALAALLADADRRLFIILVKAGDLQGATGREPDARIEVELQDRPVAIREHTVAGG